MSRQPSPHTPKGKLNNATPGTREVGLGDILDDLITSHNALVANYNVLVAKLNADAGVTDTNYATATAVPVTVLSAR
jgi:hypothetical protein